MYVEVQPCYKMNRESRPRCFPCSRAKSLSPQNVTSPLVSRYSSAIISLKKKNAKICFEKKSLHFSFAKDLTFIQSDEMCIVF